MMILVIFEANSMSRGLFYYCDSSGVGLTIVVYGNCVFSCLGTRRGGDDIVSHLIRPG